MSLSNCAKKHSRGGKALSRQFRAAPQPSLPFLFPRWFSSNTPIPSAPLEQSNLDHGSPGPPTTQVRLNAQSEDTVGSKSSIVNDRVITGLAMQGLSHGQTKDTSHIARRLHSPLIGRTTQDMREASPARPTIRKIRTPSLHQSTFPDDVQPLEPFRLDQPLDTRKVIAARKFHSQWVKRKTLKNRRLKERLFFGTDWRVALHLLEQHTLRFHKGDYQLQIPIPSASIGRIIGRFGNNLRRIQNETGCLIEITTKQSDKSSPFRANITGSEQASTKAKELIMSILDHRWLGSEGPSRDALRFAKLIKSLATMPVSRRRNRHFRVQREYRDNMVEKITQLFFRAENRSLISVEAVNEALVFFAKHHLISHIRNLFTISEISCLPLETSTFNILLKAAGKARDLHNFTFLLQLMVKRNLRPDSRTWCQFLSVTDRKEVRDIVLDKMEAKHLLSDPVVIREASRQIISHLAAEWLDAGKPIGDLLDHMDRRFTAAWYSASALNRVLDELGMRGMLEEGWDLLETARARQLVLDSVSMNTLMSRCYRFGKGHLALRFFLLLSGQRSIRPDGITYHLLFKVSWKLRLYNVARVVWRYACMTGAVSPGMYETVKRSLLDDASAPPTTLRGSDGYWRMTAGTVVAGISGLESVSNPLLESFRFAMIAPGSQSRREVALLKRHKNQVLKEDMSSYKLRWPIQPLPSILADAYALDKDWSHGMERRSLPLMLHSAIKVPTTPYQSRLRPLQARP